MNYKEELEKIEQDTRSGKPNQRTSWFWEEWRKLDSLMIQETRQQS